jgi:hypothetical protein
MSAWSSKKLSLGPNFQAPLQPGNFPGALVHPTYKFIVFLVAILLPLSAFADPATSAPDTKVAKVLSAGAFATVSRLGESDREAALRDEKLLSHHRATDPFGITVRGPLLKVCRR